MVSRMCEAASCYSFGVKKSILSRYLAELGRKGGKARLKTMTTEERRASARKAAQASAKVRSQKAKANAKKTDAARRSKVSQGASTDSI